MKIIDSIWKNLRKINALRIFAIRLNSHVSRIQTSKKIKYFDGELIIPRRHPLPAMLSQGPRESSLIFIAQTAFNSKKNHYIDVGANVGDTSLLVELHAKGPINGDLIEPSEFFNKYLQENATRLNSPTLHKKFAATSFPAETIYGEFHHWPGNAEIVPAGKNVIAKPQDQINIADLLKKSTALIKIDCEGQDLQIIEAMIEKSSDFTPIIYFECTLRGTRDLKLVKSIIHRLSANYENVVVTNPTGLLIYAGKANESFIDLCRYQIELGRLGQQSSCYYFDVAFFPISEFGIFEEVTKKHRDNFGKHL